MGMTRVNRFIKRQHNARLPNRTCALPDPQARLARPVDRVAVDEDVRATAWGGGAQRRRRGYDLVFMLS
jgi:hypothetical protein